MGNGKFIVVAGDVMVDRNWLVARPPAGTSQEHGDVPAWKVLELNRKPDVLGGAGLIARAAYSTSDSQRVCLIGAWASDFNPARAFPEDGLFAEGQKVTDRVHFVRFANTSFNTQKYRIYELSSGKTKLQSRYDWDLTPGDQYEPNPNFPPPPTKDEVSGVIVGDFKKGMLDVPGMQDALSSYEGKPFLLRSKRDLKDDLFVKLPWTVLLPNREDLSRWVGNRTPSETHVKKSSGDYSLHPELITSLHELANRFRSKRERNWAVLVKLDREGALLLRQDGKLVLFSLPEQSRGRLAGIGAGDVLMANLAPRLANVTGKAEDEVKAYRNAVQAATTYCHAAENIRDIKDWYATNTRINAEDLRKVAVLIVPLEDDLKSLRVKSFCARSVGKRLRAGKRVKNLCLQDAKWYLDDFLTINRRMGSEVGRIRSEITQYINSDEKKPFVTALCGPPGSGKSTLAKALGKALRCGEFVESNAAQWTAVEDMFLMCERIRSASISGKLPLAFIDEIDAKIGGDYWYARLLAPLWDGAYSLAGEVRTLGRVIFLLAGSNESWQSVESLMKGGKNEAKLPDLVSRFSIRPLQIERLDSPGSRSDAVYLAAFQFLQRFSSVESINSSVLHLFAQSDFPFGSRGITQVVKLFGPLRDPQKVSVADFLGEPKRLESHIKQLISPFDKKETWVDKSDIDIQP